MGRKGNFPFSTPINPRLKNRSNFCAALRPLRKIINFTHLLSLTSGNCIPQILRKFLHKNIRRIFYYFSVFSCVLLFPSVKINSCSLVDHEKVQYIEKPPFESVINNFLAMAKYEIYPPLCLKWKVYIGPLLG